MTEDREDFVQHARLSWQEYQRTGLHIMLEELEAWLDAWGTPEEKGLQSAIRDFD